MDDAKGPYTTQHDPPFRTGLVSAIESVPPYRVKVTFPDRDGMETQWLPVLVPKIMVDKFFWQPDIGEQVAVVMDEHDENGYVAGSVPSMVDAAPTGLGPSIVFIQFADGTTLQYDRTTSILTISVSPSGQALIQTADGLSVVTVADNAISVDSAAVDITSEVGDTTLDGDVVAEDNLHVASGASGVFSTPTGGTVTVQDGIVIDINP